MKIKFVYWYNILVGLCDSATGVLLLAAPETTLHLMGVAEVPTEPVYMRFIGAFVCSVGLSYWLPFRLGRSAQEFARSTFVVWHVTALVRTVVGGFVALALVSGTLAPPWISVALTDCLLAFLQFRYAGSLRSIDEGEL